MMEQQEKNLEQEPSPKPTDAEPVVKGIKEEFYDKIPISVKTLDKIIAVLIVLIILSVLIGRNVHR